MPVATIIRRSTLRATCADATDAERLRGAMPTIAARLPAMIDALLPDALAAAGLAADAAVAIRRLEVKVEVDAEAPANAIATAWARAVRDALAARLAGAPAAPDDGVHADAWRADATVIAALARGGEPPWWARDERAPAIVDRWIADDPARAAAALVELLMAGTGVASLPLAEGEAATLARRLASRLRARVGATRAASADAFGTRQAAALPAAIEARIAALPPKAARLFGDAARLALAPARASAAALIAADVDAALPAGSDADSAAARVAELVAPTPSPLAEVLGGGLLMLLRPLIDLLPPAEITADRLGAVGLAALRRCLEPLTATARRLALERDRALVAVFAGGLLPDVPLDRLPLDPAAETWLDMLVAAIPAADWAPSTLRRVYGGAEPFARTPDHARLARLVMRPGLLARTPWSAELIWPLEAADLALRRHGWDLDPGWVPWVGRSIAFRFGDEP